MAATFTLTFYPSGDPASYVLEYACALHHSMLDFMPGLESDCLLQCLLRDLSPGAELHLLLSDPSGARVHDSSTLLTSCPPFSWPHIYSAFPDFWSITPFTYLSLTSYKRVLSN
jgi:hypothetical protein